MVDVQMVASVGPDFKRPYFAPQLKCFGAVRDLTQTGSGMQSESDDGSSSGMNCSPNYTVHQHCIASDRLIKENLVRIGVHPLGIGLYLFEYQKPWRDVWGYGRQFGVMADEVEPVMPEAVSIHPDGYRTVNYAMLGIEIGSNPLH